MYISFCYCLWEYWNGVKVSKFLWFSCSGVVGDVILGVVGLVFCFVVWRGDSRWFRFWEKRLEIWLEDCRGDEVGFIGEGVSFENGGGYFGNFGGIIRLVLVGVIVGNESEESVVV